MGHTTIDRSAAETIAREWASVDGDGDCVVTSEVAVEEFGDGFRAEVVVYLGNGPFVRVGTACAVIDARGRLSPIAA
jgi:hypothetical protein